MTGAFRRGCAHDRRTYAAWGPGAYGQARLTAGRRVVHIGPCDSSVRHAAAAVRQAVAACAAAPRCDDGSSRGAVLTLALTAAPAQARSLETVVQDDANLLHRPADQVLASMSRLSALGADRVRLTANWSVLTRDPDSERAPAFDQSDPAAYEQARWAGLDRAVVAAQAAGLRGADRRRLLGAALGHRRARRGPGHARTSTRMPTPRSSEGDPPAVFGDLRPAGGSADRHGPPPPPSQDDLLLQNLVRKRSLERAVHTRSPSRPTRSRRCLAVRALERAEPPRAAAAPVDHGTGKNGRSGEPLPLPPDARCSRSRPLAPPGPNAELLVGNTSSTGGTPGQRSRGPAAVPSRARLRRSPAASRCKTPACANFKPIQGDGWAHHPYNRNVRPDTPADPASAGRRERRPARQAGPAARSARAAWAESRPGLQAHPRHRVRLRDHPDPATPADQPAHPGSLVALGRGDRLPPARGGQLGPVPAAGISLRRQGAKVSDSTARPFGRVRNRARPGGRHPQACGH